MTTVTATSKVVTSVDLPNQLIIKGGKIVHKETLQEVIHEGWPDGIEVCVVDRASLVKAIDDAFMHRIMGA